MREEFAKVLADIADADDRVLLLSGDLGYSVLDEYRHRHPSKFINVGVSEQAMIGIATGLAKEGFSPYCYSIGTFALLRPLEFIRNGPVHHDLPVRIVGTGIDREYGAAGPSHWLFEHEARGVCDAIGLAYMRFTGKEHLAEMLPLIHASNRPMFIHLSKV